MSLQNQVDEEVMSLTLLHQKHLKQQQKLNDIQKQCERIQNGCSNPYSFYYDELQKLELFFPNVIKIIKSFLQNGNDQTKKLSYVLLKENVKALKEFSLQAALLGRKLNQKEIQEQINFSRINEDTTQLLEELNNQHGQLKQSIKQNHQSYLSTQQNPNLNSDVEQLSCINKKIQEYLEQIQQEESTILEHEQKKFNLEHDRNVIRKQQTYWSNLLRELEQVYQYDQQTINNKELKQVEEQQQPMCIIIYDDQDYIRYHNKDIDVFLTYFLQEVKTNYQNNYKIYSLNHKQDRFDVKRFRFSRDSQDDTEKKILQQMQKVLENNSKFQNFHIKVIGASNSDQNNKLDDQSLIKKIMNSMKNNNQKISVDIIDVSIVPNYQTLTKLFQAFQKHEINSSIAHYNLSGDGNVKQKTQNIMEFLVSQKNCQKEWSYNNSLNNLYKQQDRTEKIKLLYQKELEVKQQIDENNIVIEKHQNIIKTNKEELKTLQKQVFEMKLRMIKVEDSQFNSIKVLQEIICSLGKNNELYIKLVEIQQKISLFNNEFLKEKQQHKENLTENVIRLMKYLNTFILTLNLPKKEYTTLLILQLYIFNNNKENICLDQSLNYMLNDITKNKSGDFCEFFENKINFEVLLNQGLDEYPQDISNEHKQKLQTIIELIKQFKIESIFTVQRIKSTTKLLEKMDKFSKLLQCSS